MYVQLRHFTSIRLVRPGFLVVSILAAVCMFAAFRSSASRFMAATPSSGTLSPTSPSISYTGGPFVVPTNSSDSAAGPVDCSQTSPCEDFGLTIDIPQTYKDSHPQDLVKVEVSWSDPTGGQDLDIFLVDNPDDRTYPAHGGNGG
jgi:hypothetical protein